MRLAISVALLLSASVAGAAGKPARVLEPSSKWIVDYAANQCRLIRLFGNGDEAVKLIVEQTEPESAMTVMLVGHVHGGDDNNVLAFEPLASAQISGGQSFVGEQSRDTVLIWNRCLGRGRWGFIPEALSEQMLKADPVGAEAASYAPFSERFRPIKRKDHDWSVERGKLSSEDEDGFTGRADQLTAMVVNPGRSDSVSLHTGAMGKPLQVLENCASGSLKDWGIDPQIEATISTRAHPQTDPYAVFTSDDYPQAALRSFKEDELQAWLNIDAAGRISSCRVISDFATPEINNAICGMIGRKEIFAPARTKDGSPVPDYYVQSFTFRLR